MNDLKSALRQLLKNPGFTAVAVLTLALGIGANTAIFGIVNAVLLKPLPYENPQQLVTISDSNPKRGFTQINASAASFFGWRDRTTSFSSLAAEVYESFNVATETVPFHVRGAYVTANYFEVLGPKFALGRGFATGEDELGRHQVVVITHDLWQTQFGGRRDIVGHTIRLSGEQTVVVGVLAPEFRTFNPRNIVGRPTAAFEPKLWMPYPFTPQERASDGRFFIGVGRLKSGVTVQSAQAEMNRLAAVAAEENPDRVDWGVAVRSLHEQVTAESAPMLVVILGSVGSVLLIACVNLANLSLARGRRRIREFAIRAALGAHWRQLIRLPVLECLLLAMIGGSLSLLIARWLLSVTPAWVPDSLPRIDSLALDWPVFGFALLVTVVTGFLTGLLPALQVVRSDPQTALAATNRGLAGGRVSGWRAGLAIAQVAVAVTLLAGAGLFLRSFQRLAAERPGFEPEQVLAADFTLHWQAYGDDSKRLRFLADLIVRISALPGVEAAATVHGAPFGSMLASTKRIALEGESMDMQNSARLAGYRQASPGYFQLMRIPVLRGREFASTDDESSRPVVIINQTLAKELFGGGDPLGRRITAGATGTNLAEVVGVIADVKSTGLDAPARPEVYLCCRQYAVWIHSLVVRTRDEPAALAAAINREFLALDREVPAYNFRPLDDAVSGSIASKRFVTLLTATFGAVALGLVVLGIAGVLTNAVVQRRQELGVRKALGAQDGDLVRLILKEGMKLVALGSVIGILGALAWTRLIASQLHHTSPFDLGTCLGVLALLLATTLFACWLPARQATKVEPMEAMRTE
ncbi:MAG: ABC transporter permease [Verrucomicrobiae bacterium]|nr:ABC transporter permease [Verrucomicrobiae bacterium]